MITDIKSFFVYRNDNLQLVLDRINDSAEGIVILVNEDGKFSQTVTDGDIRRILINKKSLDVTLNAIPKKKSITCSEGLSTHEALEIMNLHQVEHLPVLDEENYPVGLIIKRDIDKRILLSTPHIGDFERKYVQEAFSTNWIAPLGPNVDAFEKEVAEYLGVSHAAATNSGTAAIHLALILLDVNAGDTVFCSTFTFVASANPIIYQGAVPVFIDSEPDSWNMSPQALERAMKDAKAVDRLPKAVIVVNIYGQSADFDKLKIICLKYNVPIIEDAAESLGATYNGRHSGTIGDIGIFSFNGNKIITTSGGGMIVSNNGELIEKARFLSTQAREEKDYYEHKHVGYNYRMSNVLAGIGRGQLQVLDERVKTRRSIYENYVNGLQEVKSLEWMPELAHSMSTHWLSACTINNEFSSITPEFLIKNLRNENIEARPVWKPMHKQPLFKNCKYYSHSEYFSVSDDLFSKGLCLPSGSNMNSSQINRIIDSIKKVFNT